MAKDLIVIHKNQGRIGTSLIAAGFERRHEQVARLIKKYEDEFKDFNTLEVRRVRSKGRPVEEYLLDFDQFMYLGTLFRNTDVARKFKHNIIKQFKRTRQELESVKTRQSNTDWITARDFGKESRLTMTDCVKEFIEYAKDQGSKNANHYYANISKMLNGLLFVLAKNFIQVNLRDYLDPSQLIAAASAEQIITKGIQDGMKKKMFYKDIYKDIKAKVMQFAALTGQTHVIEEQLKLEE